jgi:hypothetical protein
VRSIVKSVPDPQLVWRLEDLRFVAPSPTVDEFGAIEAMARDELEQHLTAWSFWRG